MLRDTWEISTKSYFRLFLHWEIFHFEETNFDSVRTGASEIFFHCLQTLFRQRDESLKDRMKLLVCSFVGKRTRGMLDRIDRAGRKENRFFFGKRDWHPFAETNSGVHVSIDKQRRAIRTTGSGKRTSDTRELCWKSWHTSGSSFAASFK